MKPKLRRKQSYKLWESPGESARALKPVVSEIPFSLDPEWFFSEQYSSGSNSSGSNPSSNNRQVIIQKMVNSIRPPTKPPPSLTDIAS